MAISGIIMGEYRGSGVVLLLRHKNDMSLTFAIDQYLDIES